MTDARVRNECTDLVVGAELPSRSVRSRQEDLLHVQRNLVNGPHALPAQQLLFEDVVVQALCRHLSLQTRTMPLQILGVTDRLGDLNRLFGCPQNPMSELQASFERSIKARG